MAGANRAIERIVEQEEGAHTAVDLMFAAIKPLGLLLASLPVGPDHPGVTAGASFQLPGQLPAPTPPFGLAPLQ